VRGDVVSYNWKVGAMVERTIVKKDENKEVNIARVEASKNGAGLAPALDLRSAYLKDRRHRFRETVSHDSDTPPLNTVLSMPNSLSQPLRAAARSVYRDLWRASTTTFAGAVASF
jgi:hypothetical protein